MTQHDADVLGEENPSSEIINSEEFHALLDSTMSRSVTQAIQSAMGLMSANIAQSISSALMNTNAPVTQNVSQPTGKRTLTTGPGRKASCKTHHTKPITSKKLKMGMATPATEAVVTPRKRAQYRAKSVRNWKAAKAALDYSSSESFAEEVSDESDEPDNDIPSEEDIPDNSAEVGLVTLPVPTDTATLLDPQGEPLFDPDNLQHPRSAEWFPADHIAKYIAARVRKPLDKITRNKLRAECPRPTVPDLACDTPEVDPKIAQFLGKSGWKAKKGLDFSLRVCQDKVLDIMGPCAKIFELVETGLSNDTPVDLPTIKGWIQRVICLIGNANTAIATERRKAILLKIEPKLVNMAVTEPGPQAKGLLFGDNFVKELGSFVHTFTALDKAQSNMKRVFQNKVFGGAGRFRGRLPGRGSRGPFRGSRGPTSTRSSFVEHRPASTAFFPQRSRPWQNRGARGSYQSRRPYVSGYLIDFVTLPVQSIPPHSIPFSPQDHVLVSQEVSNLLSKGAITAVPPDSEGFLSNLFLVPKKGGGTRPVINLRPLNAFVAYQHFKMEGIHCLRDLLLLGDWMVKMDLQDAYLTVPIAVAHQRYLRFRWNHQLWQFTCLPFGLSSAPWCFTKLLKPVMSFLRRKGVRLIIYLDDLLLMSQDKSTLQLHLSWTVDILQALGFLINWEKSCLSPSQLMEFLGFDINSIHGSLHLPKSKVKSIRKEIKKVLCLPQITIRQLARVIGLLAASIQAIFPGPLHYRALQQLKIRSLRTGLTYDHSIPIDYNAREELSWWLTHIDAWNGRAIFGMVPDLIVESDASLLGWGAQCGPISTGGHWSRDEKALHINCLELLAGEFAIRSFAANSRNCSILLRLDNTSAVRYINHLGGTKSLSLSHQATEFWKFCLAHNISVKAEHIPGLSNTDADWNSRHLADSSDWRLHPRIFHQLENLWGPLDIDLFASRLNTQLPKFYSWRPDPEALASDAFLQTWQSSRHYALPPFCLISRTLIHLHRSDASLVLVTPWWDSQPWFPTLLELSLDMPRLLPSWSASVSSLVGIRGPWFIPGVPCSTLALLEGAWAPGTRQSYRRAWDMWASWCMEHHADPVSAPVSHILRFLTLLYENGRAYRTINVYRSAISAGHSGFGGFSAGKQLLVCRLLKGIRLARPPVPRYSSLWDVNVILLLFEHWPDNSDLTFQQLSSKLVMLFCLISRVSDVRALDVSSRSFTPEGVLFNISRRTKTLITSVFYPSFPHHPKLCPVLCLKEYELRTSVLRDPERPELFLALRKPHRPVATTSLARWVKWVLHSAGVDTSIFGPHSTRGAMASKAFALGCRLEDLLKAADWSRESTFREFYFRAPSHFSDSVIAQL
ncbi:LOW QUALITY PROTEIN: uncharacterized protein RCH25_053096 [Pelodytes ibericus]